MTFPLQLKEDSSFDEKGQGEQLSSRQRKQHVQRPRGWQEEELGYSWKTPKGFPPAPYSCWIHTLLVSTDPQNQDSSMPCTTTQPFITKGGIYQSANTFLFHFWGILGK